MKKKKQKLSVAARFSNATQVPFDMAAGCPYIIMCHNREVVIEDAGKLVHYDGVCVKVMQRRNRVCIQGVDLKLVFLSNGDLKVNGFVTNVGFE